MSDTETMDSTTQGTRWTYDEYARLPDDGDRHEILGDEVLVTPSPSPAHQHILATLLVELRGFVERHGLGRVLPEVDLLMAPGTFLRPDLLFVPAAALAGLTSRGVETTPGLVVEILSPSSGSIDRVRKPPRYKELGVPEYWVVDPLERVVWVWRFAEGPGNVQRVADRLVWRPEGTGLEWTVPVERLFEGV